MNIYTLVRRRRPRVIIEFGSGCSTLMFAQALAHNHAEDGGEHPHLYSVETSERFRALTASYLPAPLRPFADLLHSGIEVGELHGVPVMWHRAIPAVLPNLIYLDGPDYQDFSDSVTIQVEGVLREPTAPSDYAILIDGRWATYQFTRQHLVRRYQATENTLYSWELLEPA